MATEVGLNGKAIPGYFSNCKAEYGTLVNKQGLKLQKYTWPASLQGHSTPKGFIVFVHGVSSHLLYEYMNHITYPEDSEFGAKTGHEGAIFHDPTYEDSWIEKFNKEGFTCLGIDQQSYGLSEGMNQTDHYFESFQDLVDDQIQLCQELIQQHPGMPVFLIGLSMGGCVATRVSEQLNLSGYIFLAPMLSLEQLKRKPLNKILLPMSGCVSRAAPRIRVAQKENHTWLEMHKHILADPLTENALIRARVAHECLVAVEQARADMPKIQSPFVSFHATMDKLCDPEGSMYLFEHGGSSDKTLEILEEPYRFHMLNAEPGHDQLFKLSLSWINSRLKAPVTRASTVQQVDNDASPSQELTRQ